MKSNMKYIKITGKLRYATYSHNQYSGNVTLRDAIITDQEGCEVHFLTLMIPGSYLEGFNDYSVATFYILRVKGDANRMCGGVYALDVDGRKYLHLDDGLVAAQNVSAIAHPLRMIVWNAQNPERTWRYVAGSSLLGFFGAFMGVGVQFPGLSFKLLFTISLGFALLVPFLLWWYCAGPLSPSYIEWADQISFLRKEGFLASATPAASVTPAGNSKY